MANEPNFRRARGWLYGLGVLGIIIVIFSVMVNHFASGVSILGYIVGFFCVLLGVTAALNNPDKPRKKDDKRPSKRTK